MMRSSTYLMEITKEKQEMRYQAFHQSFPSQEISSFQDSFTTMECHRFKKKKSSSDSQVI
jgi:hypothetical protein